MPTVSPNSSEPIRATVAILSRYADHSVLSICSASLALPAVGARRSDILSINTKCCAPWAFKALQVR